MSDPIRFFHNQWEAITNNRHLLHAVILVFDEMEAAGMKPGAEIWPTNRAYFTNRAFERVVERWSEVTSRPVEQFPWTEDAVVTTWVSWRKASGEKEHQIREQLLIEDDRLPETLELLSDEIHQSV